LIEINLLREGKAAVRGAAAAGPSAGAGAPVNVNNALIGGLLVAGLLISGGYWFIKDRQLSAKKDQVLSRKSEADKLQAIIKEVEQFQKQKDSLQRRIDLINQLKQNQKGPVRVMDRISQDLPDLVWLEHMTENAGQITLNGKGLNPNAIANFVENIKADPLFEEPEVSNINQVTTVPLVYSFDMSFHFTYGPKKPGGEAGAATDTAGAGGKRGGAATTATTTASGGVPGGKSK
jgi:Tfp pilus assembly protein PilN